MPVRVVADASVIVKWVVPEAYSEEALRLRDDLLNGKVEVHAPSVLLLEVASALRKYHLRGLLGRDVAERALTLIASCGLSLHELDRELAFRSLRVSLDCDITVYDATYVALALSLGTVMYTTDEELLSNRELQRLGVVKHVGEYNGS